jgi:aryl-alcohol dehydrogenase-like predicted oxidoreductase
MYYLKSKIILGTAQFGMSYGVSNKDGKTSESDVFDIINYAKNCGIKYLDTASAYGKSEFILGKVANNNDWKIITKVPSLKDFKGNNHKSRVKELFNKSLTNLNRNSIDTLLIHSCEDLFTKYGHSLYEALIELKEAKKINKIGVSVYNKSQINRLLGFYDVDLIQAPINILDQRLILEDYLGQIKKSGVEVHVRSIFLQGLLLMPFDEIPSFFKPIYPQIRLFHEKAKSLSISPLSLALSYVDSIKEVNHILIGVNSLNHLKEIAKAQIVKISTKDFFNLGVFDENYVNPSKWTLN